jgi:monoamine oxidase
LKLGLVGAASPWIGCTTTARSAQPASVGRVVVIGAGVAGLAAAQALQARGVEVIVLEGRDRIGGRVWTDRRWPDLPLDLGASWIHGHEGNPLTALSDQLGLRRVVTDYGSATAFSADGQDASDAADAAERMLADLVEDLTALRAARRAAAKPDLSLAQAIEQVLIDHGPLSAADAALLRWAVNSAIEHDYAADASQLSLYHWDADDSFNGDDLLFPDGYDAIPQLLAKGLDIRLGHVVSAVRVTAEGVTVETSQGAVDADRCLVTLPLGVLQAERVKFSPPLPAEKRAAINRLGMGLLNKLYLRWPKPFWTDRLTTHLLHLPGAPPGEWSESVNLFALFRAPALLMFNAGSVARAKEPLSDSDTVASALRALRAAFGPDVPDPEAAAVTRWASDPFALGAYSFQAVGSSPEDRRALAAPVGDRLLFAGEATHDKHPATVHGAYLSGLREAARLIDTPADSDGDDEGDGDDDE